MDPSLYDERYFRECCAGHRPWARSEGREATPYFLKALQAAGLRPGEVLVDIGTGRAELVAAAAEQGAAWAVGIEYSQDAIELGRRTLEARGVTDRAEVRKADARATHLEDEAADVVTMLDVVEHLTPVELDAALAEALRILRPGGRLLIHTAPNRIIYDVTYPVVRALHPVGRRKWPADPRHPLEHAMHVNEQTPASLRRLLKRLPFARVRVRLGSRTGGQGRQTRWQRRLARVPLVRRYVVRDIWAVAEKPI